MLPSKLIKIVNKKDGNFVVNTQINQKLCIFFLLLLLFKNTAYLSSYPNIHGGLSKRISFSVAAPLFKSLKNFFLLGCINTDFLESAEGGRIYLSQLPQKSSFLTQIK